jgi:uncharacterized protein YuzE
MRVTYDPKALAGYIHLTDAANRGGGLSRTVKATENVILDFDADGHLVGIELLSPQLIHPQLFAMVNKEK